MKKTLISAIISAIVLIAFHAAAGPLLTPFHGPITINWKVSQQKLDDAPKYPGNGKTSITGSGSSKTTNVVQVYKYTFTTGPFTSPDFLALLENSLNTNFPAGTKLESDGTSLFVTDSTGTNEIVNITSVVSGSTTNSVTSELETETVTYKKSGSSAVAGSTASGSEYIAVIYDDSALITRDGTTTKFRYDGLSDFTATVFASRSTEEVLTGRGAGTFTIHGFGYGTIRGTPIIISGTAIASPAGSYSQNFGD
ncbi:MAG TPA: hypothetical protein VMR33_10115 [Candidatus Baltobacteraceae bacterium]|jgi:hypothetical protein|nr:hypothetical protein [Candidatus Baltobacteraceae bacterium]